MTVSLNGGGLYGVLIIMAFSWVVKAIFRGKRGSDAASQVTGGGTLSGFTTLMTGGTTTGIADEATIDPRFAAHYAQYINPQMAEFEERRVAALSVLRQRMMIVLPVLAISGVLALYFASQNPTSSTSLREGVANLAVIISMIALGWACWPVMLYKGSIKQKLFPEVFRFFGPQWHYNPDGIGGADITLRAADFAGKNMLGGFQQLKSSFRVSSSISSGYNDGTRATIMAPYMEFGILPAHETAFTKDALNGDYKTVPIALLQCTLQTTTGTGKDRRTMTDFHGLVITIDVLKRFSGHTTVRRDHGKLGNWFGKQFAGNLQPVKLEDPRFEERYEVYGTDQVEARYLLTNSFMERLVALEDLIAGKNGGRCNIQCAFKDAKLLITLPMTGEWFKTGSIFKPATFIGDINTILQEMDQLFAIVDILQLDDRTGL